MEKISYIISGTALLFILWFLAPLLAGGKINIGNVTGFAVFGVLFFYGIFLRRVNAFLAGAWAHTCGRIVLSMLLAMAAVILFLVAAETFFMVRAVRNRPPEQITAVVLGCSVKGSRPSTILTERLDAAYQYLLENPDALCILSGGQGEGEDISEAECMYRCLTEKGIAPERLILEDKSSNTQENLMFTREIMESRGMELKIAVITSEFHSYRGAMVASSVGFECYSVPAGTFWLYLPSYYVRELYAILYYWLFH